MHGQNPLSLPNDQDHRAGGAAAVSLDQLKTFIDRENVEAPNREPAPVHRLVMHLVLEFRDDLLALALIFFFRN